MLSWQQWYGIAEAPRQRDGSALTRKEHMPIKQCMQVTAHEMVSRARERVWLLGTQKVLLRALDRLQKQMV
jgi:hypothetical protein